MPDDYDPGPCGRCGGPLIDHVAICRDRDCEVEAGALFVCPEGCDG